MKSSSELDDRGGNEWLILAVLLLALTSLRFAYHAALFSIPLSDLMAGAFK